MENIDVAILFAGENLSEGLALQVDGKLLSEDIRAHHYKIIDNDIDEDGYLDKVNTYTTKVARLESVVIILSKKYLTESIFCQEEIRELVGKHKKNFRGHVYVICSEEEIYEHVRSEPQRHALLDIAKELIERHKYALSSTNSCSKQRINEIGFCENTIEDFLNEISEKRSYLYKHTEIDQLITQLLDNIKGNDALIDEDREDDLTLFLSMFNACFPDETTNTYCTPLKLSSKNKDINIISNLYSSCMSPRATNFIEHIVKDRDKLKPYSSGGIHYDKYIMKKFIENHYITPSAIYKEVGITGEVVDTFNVSSEEILSNIYTNLDDNKMVFLEGGVGEGKTTFIYKLIYETFAQSSQDGNTYIYKHLENRNGTSADSIYNELVGQLDSDPNSIIVIDNLDSFSFEHERFMFTKNGFSEFKIQIQKTRDIVSKLKSLITENKVKSILVSVRPYVLSHFYDDQVLENGDYAIVANSCIYSLAYKEDIAEKVIISRIGLFRDMINKLLNDDAIQSGRKTIFEKHKENILSLLNLISYQTHKDGTLKKHKIEVIHKGKTEALETYVPKKNKTLNDLLKITTQGLRTIVRLYSNLGYNDKLFSSYFTNSIFLLYTLGLHKKYSQILPFRCPKRKNNNAGKTYNYPNMFLSVAVSEANQVLVCTQPHKVTYWLKIFLLLYIYKNKDASIQQILDAFSKYDIELVKIALGSLGTINEYNCIEYDFPSISDVNYNDFTVQTLAKLTKRGKHIIKNTVYLNYNNLEFFIDDWQLPKPRINQIFNDSFHDKDFLKTLIQIETKGKTFSYGHLSGEQDSDFDFREFMRYKSKLIIWYTYIFEASLKKELQYYNINFWDNDSNLFKEKRDEIIKGATSIVRSHYSSQTEEGFMDKLNDFSTKCNNYNNLIDAFFQKVFEKDIKAICLKC